MELTRDGLYPKHSGIFSLMETSPDTRYHGAVYGAYIGDALAMPAHWYYNTDELRRTFGRIDRYLTPPREHSGSILWRSTYAPREPAFDILGGQRQYWGKRGVHYHQFLKPGENTLNLKLLRLALAQVDANGAYDRDRYLCAYQSFLLDPAGHRDTYVEECHRGFFENLRAGRPPEKAAVQEKHIGGMVAVVPLYAALRQLGHLDAEARRSVHAHVEVTHAGRQVSEAVETILTVASEVWEGSPLADVLTGHLTRQDLPYLQGPIVRLSERPPEQVLGRVYSTACYLEDSLPATFYLALRYAGDPEEALIANTMAGGDNCHRGAVLGALLGLDGGQECWPEDWRSGLVEPTV
ncbi:MAG: ADP-ribosylglycohydrolase family protein [Spirochaetaceae bacterium]|nr:MAG: ADP-ribosylglycohydrolase family protein [Spirochaetaceae bacterium]